MVANMIWSILFSFSSKLTFIDNKPECPAESSIFPSFGSEEESRHRQQRWQWPGPPHFHGNILPADPRHKYVFSPDQVAREYRRCL